MTRRFALGVTAVLLAGITFGALSGCASSEPQSKSAPPDSAVLINGRKLTPAGSQVTLGNFPTGGAATADGRYLWTVSTGFGNNDIRIVDTTSKRVIQTVELPSASGGIALDSANRLAYVSGITLSRWQPTKSDLPGAEGNCVLVYSWDAQSGKAEFVRAIPLPAPANSPAMQSFPPKPQRSNSPTGSVSSWPQKLAVSADGKQLLVPLNLADSAAIISLDASDSVKYVPVGGYPFGAAITPDGSMGVVSNEAPGTLSVIDMAKGVKLTDITVGPPLSHPQGVVIDSEGERAYVAMSAMDQVAVVDLKDREVERTIAVGRKEGLGTMPVAVALSPDGTRLFVAESGTDSIAVIRIPGATPDPELDWSTVGNIPTAEDPQVVATAAKQGENPARLFYVSARGLGVGPNLTGPNPVLPFDPLFWAFNPSAPATDVFSLNSGVTYLPSLVNGQAGLMDLPSDKKIAEGTPATLKQTTPVDAVKAPADTPLRANGPIKHVFFIVRENRSYDQLLGDLGRGNGDPKLVVFGEKVTPNLHALVTRFPLLDNAFANSEASVQGHYWTSAGSVPDYVDRNWVHEYAGRGRPNDFGAYAITFPGKGFMFNQAERQGISYFNYGEAFSGIIPLEDRDQTPQTIADGKAVAANSDLGPGLTPGGTYSSSFIVGQNVGADPRNPLDGQTFDCSLPKGAPPGATSRVDSFRARFASQLASGTVPTFNYLIMMSDHTRGTQTGFPTPSAMVADSDLALGQLVDTISHSEIWESSVIFVVEDDSQDGADHVDAHRIPVAVISPYAKKNAIITTRYDQLSVLRSMQLIMGMNPLSINDAMATPMYDVFTPKPLNSDPIDAIPAKIDLLERNTAAAPWAAESNKLALNKVDTVPQMIIDTIVWKSVYGAASAPPPPGPNAEYEMEEE